MSPRSLDDSRTEEGREKLPSLDRIEFVVRFTCRGLLGLLVACRFFFFLYHRPFLNLGVTSVLILCCGLGTVRYGDRFWEEFFGR